MHNKKLAVFIYLEANTDRRQWRYIHMCEILLKNSEKQTKKANAIVVSNFDSQYRESHWNQNKKRIQKEEKPEKSFPGRRFFERKTCEAVPSPLFPSLSPFFLLLLLLLCEHCYSFLFFSFPSLSLVCVKQELHKCAHAQFGVYGFAKTVFRVELD